MYIQKNLFAIILLFKYFCLFLIIIKLAALAMISKIRVTIIVTCELNDGLSSIMD